jgi:ankyrin repeat protein
MSPLHYSIFAKQIEACRRILEYEQVSNQNIDSGITMSRIAKATQIQALMEKALEKRRNVILVCFSIAINPF